MGDLNDLAFRVYFRKVPFPVPLGEPEPNGTEMRIIQSCLTQALSCTPICLISNRLHETPKWNRMIEIGGLHRIPTLLARI